MATDRSAVNLTQLFNELHRCNQNNDYEKALKVVNKILQEDKSNVKARHCKIVCFIQTGNFQSALSEIGNSEALSNSLLFEKAYCQYRLNKVKEALQTIDNIKEPNFAVKELRAQTLYRLERFDECYQIYVDLIKNSDDEYEEERATNLSAVIASLTMNDSSFKSNIDPSEKTFEQYYNKACILLGQKKYQEALEKLTIAEEQCRKTLEEEGVTEEEIESELGIIRSQIGYSYQMQKKPDIALKMYNQVLKQKPTDTALISVTSNNIVTINKEQNVFDSKKKMKTALSEINEAKLNRSQKRAIMFNNCLLLVHSNQGEKCRNQLADFKKSFPEAVSEAILLEASSLCKEKKLPEAIKLLKESSQKRADLALETVFASAQLLLGQGEINQASEVLRLLGQQSYKPGILSALVTFYLNQEKKEEATKLLTEAIKWYEKNKPNSSELLTLYRENARLLMEIGQAKNAVNLLEHLRKSNPSNLKLLSLLIKAYSQFDSKTAQEISKNLPSIENIISSVDVDQLETSNWSLGAKYVKKTAKSDFSPVVNANVKKEKKKSKKKKILPKNYDPNVDPDPERWLPRYQRSTYKKKKDKRGMQGVGKGTQGSVNEIEIKPSKSTTNATAAASPQGPRQQRPTQKKKKKSGKR